MEIDRQQLQIKVGQYAVGSSTALPNPRWLGMVQHYRRQAGARMIPLDREGVVQRLPNVAYHVSRKVDGEFTVLIVENGDVASLNPGGTTRVGLPFMEEAANLLQRAGVGQLTLLAGELYVAAETSGKRPRVHDVTRLARNPGSIEALGRLRFAAFDALVWDGEDPR